MVRFDPPSPHVLTTPINIAQVDGHFDHEWYDCHEPLGFLPADVHDHVLQRLRHLHHDDDLLQLVVGIFLRLV